MKIKIGFFLVMMLATAVLVNAQPPRRTVEERVKTVHEKMDSAFKLEAAKLTKVDDLFKDYYTKTDKAREELMSGGGERPSREAVMEKMQPLMEARDKELKTILTEDQFKKWKEEIEPAMMPRRGGGGGGGNR